MLSRKYILNILYTAIYLTFPLMVWKGLQLLTNSSSPLFIVESATLEPYFPNRGDLLFLRNFEEESVKIGDLVVFKVGLNINNIPVVHRVIKIQQERINFTNSIKFLTKGDSNLLDDRNLYPSGVKWLTKADLIGRVCGYLPYAGLIIIAVNDNIVFKCSFLFIVIVYVFLVNQRRKLCKFT